MNSIGRREIQQAVLLGVAGIVVVLVVVADMCFGLPGRLSLDRSLQVRQVLRFRSLERFVWLGLAFSGAPLTCFLVILGYKLVLY